MSAISTILARLRAAIWAIDVRDDIANAIEQCYSDVSNPTLKTEALEAALQTKIDEGKMAALTIGDSTITGAKLVDGTIPKAKLDPSITFDADAALDTTSTNAIQNKVVASELATVKADLGDISEGSEIDVNRSSFVNMSGYYIGGTYNTIQAASGTATMYIPCYPNTRYTISKVLSDRFVIGYTSTIPQANMSLSNLETHNDQTSVEYQTGSDAAYLCIYYRRTADTLSESEIYNSISISYISDTDLTAVDKVARREIEALTPELSDELKEALFNCFAHVAWIDAQGRDCYDALETALGIHVIKNVAIILNHGYFVGDGQVRINAAENAKRAYIASTQGEHKLRYYNNGVSGDESPYYPIQIPVGAKYIWFDNAISTLYTFTTNIMKWDTSNNIWQIIQQGNFYWAEGPSGSYEANTIYTPTDPVILKMDVSNYNDGTYYFGSAFAKGDGTLIYKTSGDLPFGNWLGRINTDANVDSTLQKLTVRFSF